MRKFLVLLLTIVLFATASYSQSSILNCSPIKFTGVAPSPWAIDGQINDWETIFGPVNSDPVFPFGPNIGNNGSYDPYGADDFDNPDPKNDLRVSGIIHDDYNVYFYFRRIDNNNFPNKAFYFFDINIDGLMSNGEPVIAINFNSQKVNKLSLCRYIPLNPLGDPIGGQQSGTDICQVDGMSMRGRIEEISKSQSTALLPNEIFSAETTENGYGVELAVPWRLISQYKYFIYHIALQKGTGLYDPAHPSDNASGCTRLLDLIGEPDFEIQSSSVTTIIPGLSFRIDITFKNLTPAILSLYPTHFAALRSFVSITDIVQRDNLPIDVTQFSVTVDNTNLQYFEGTLSNLPVVYRTFESGVVYSLAPFSTKTVSIQISFPPNYSVQSATIEIVPSANFKFVEECSDQTGGGGKPINPVGYDLGGGEERTGINPNINETINGNEQDKEVRVYPNPSNGSTNLILPASKGSFEITLTDYTGRMIRKWEGIRQNIFKIENLKPGFYLLNIRSANRTISTVKKIIVK